jgi:hypothetical protein
MNDRGKYCDRPIRMIIGRNCTIGCLGDVDARVAIADGDSEVWARRRWIFD